MSLTALLWLALFAALMIRGFTRPIWSLCAYLMTFFAAPPFWWWGRGTLMSITMSWNLWAAILLAIAVGMHWSNRLTLDRTAKCAFFVLALFTINAGIVQLLFADNPDHSWKYFDLAWKQAGLVLLTYFAVQDRDDLRRFLIALFLGCAFIGFQVVVVGAGSIEKGRLEGVYLPGAGDTNGLSGALSLGLPIAAYLFLSKSSSLPLRCGVGIGSVFILETLFRSNSRGAFLALIAATGWLLIATKGTARKKMLMLCALGMVVVLFQAKDVNIWERFGSTFVSAEERDGSANERIEYWKSALNMIGDYPLGSGGEAAFNSNRGYSYISHIRDFGEFRAVHNGYLDIAAGWGIQGLFLFLLMLGLSFYFAFKVSRRSHPIEDSESILIGAVIQSILISQAVVALFISSLDNEWFYWCFTLLLLYGRLYSNPENVDEPVIEMDLVDEGKENKLRTNILALVIFHSLNLRRLTNIHFPLYVKVYSYNVI